MRRLVLAILVVSAALAGPGSASAREVASIAVCGADGCTRITDQGALRGFQSGGRETSAPNGAEPFYSVRVRIRDEQGRAHDAWTTQFLPRSGLIRAEDDRGVPRWTQPPSALRSALRRAGQGHDPHAASTLGPLRDPAPDDARVHEVYQPAGRAAADGSASPTHWIETAGGALLALALGGTLLLRRRRRARPHPAAAATS